jgi:hypothetical protein
MSFSPNLKVLTDWRSSLTVSFSLLRRIKFIIEGDFSFGDFDPQSNFNGMTVTNYLVNRARYLRIGNLFIFSLDIRATLAAPFAQAVNYTIPATATGTSASVQGGGIYGYNAGVADNGAWGITGATNIIYSLRPSLAAYTAGSYIFIANGVIEVI